MWTKIRDYGAALIEANPVIAFYVMTVSPVIAFVAGVILL